jgi:hypothetical protein
MAKFRPGIPQGFDLNVAPVKPVTDLGDYLDEPGVSPVRAVKVPEPQPVAPSPESPLVEAVTAVDERFDFAAPNAESSLSHRPTEPLRVPQRNAVPFPVTPPERVREPVPEAEDLSKLPKAKAPRREISMTPETLRMSDELLEMIRSATGQRDAKANELFHAAILLLYEVRGELDLHRVPKRGKWGTPMARAFPVALKSAFLEAVIERARKDQRRVG